MKLLYHSIPYESVVPSVESSNSRVSHTQAKICLIYRGNTYEYQPPETQTHLVDKAIASDCRTVTLIYRGQTYKRQLPGSQAYQLPRALNWRWRLQS